jgi:transcription initiation factor TFIID subunit 9
MKIEGSADVGDKSTPKDAQVMAAILRDMGITDYEPRVINQVIFFN